MASGQSAQSPHVNGRVVSKGEQKIFPVLLSGGAGARLWPLSREKAPKHLLRPVGEETLFQRAALRAMDAALFAPLTVIAGASHRFALAEQLRDIGAENAEIVLEPAPRNTAAAAAVAALTVARRQPDALMLLAPSDHVIADTEAFRATVRTAAEAARAGHLTLFGIEPTEPATGYGYIRAGEPLAAGAPARRVAEFVEKPDAATAEAYLESGDYLWNSGIFLMPVETLMAELRSLEPDLLAAATEALERAERDRDFVRLDAEAFARCRSVPIDTALMERTRKAAVVPAAFGWSDVGSWSALWSIAERDAAGNATSGDVLAFDTRGCYIRSEGSLVATLGVDDLVVVATADAVLVTRRDRDQDIRWIVDRLRVDDLGRV